MSIDGKRIRSVNIHTPAAIYEVQTILELDVSQCQTHVRVKYHFFKLLSILTYQWSKLYRLLRNTCFFGYNIRHANLSPLRQWSTYDIKYLLIVVFRSTIFFIPSTKELQLHDQQHFLLTLILHEKQKNPSVWKYVYNYK
jgi:hypothetical protein